MQPENILLKTDDARVYYGESQIIKGIGFTLAPRETLAIMGRNGMGKSTLLKALIGILPMKSGTVSIDGTNISGMESYKRVAHGIAYVPQGRMIFPNLTVEENVQTGLESAKSKVIPDNIYSLFPVLFDFRSRKAGNLSGGQQQQLAIARALVTKPKVLLLDEPTEGLQPSIIKEIATTLNYIKQHYRISIIVTEQVLPFTLSIADRFLVIENGMFIHEEKGDTVNSENIKRFLTV